MWTDTEFRKFLTTMSNSNGDTVEQSGQANEDDHNIWSRIIYPGMRQCLIGMYRWNE